MEKYSKEILDNFEIQKSHLQTSCSNVIQNIVNSHYAETSQKILEMIFKDKNINNVFPENVNKINK